MMKIKPSTLTADIQEVFSNKYPLLKIKFYKTSHMEFEGSHPLEEILDNNALQELNVNISEGKVNISAEVTAKELESDFKNNYGLHVQVFRRSGDLWLQTSKTDNWTLKKHQQKAMETI